MGYVTREMIDRAKEMDLLTYLQTYEPQELVHFGGSTYCTREHDSLKISNGKWCWFSRGIGGRTALDYLIKVKEIPFTEAVERIVGRAAGQPPISCTRQQPEQTKTLLLPQVSRCAAHAVEYLHSRGIDYELIDFCIRTGRLYESYPHHNAVFVGKDKDGQPRYACLRGIGTDFKGEATGSDKRFSFSIPAEESSQVLYLFESAIDLLSFAAMAQEDRLPWRSQHLLSLAGVYQPKKNLTERHLPLALSQYLRDHREIQTMGKWQKTRKITGFRALYLYYCYKLGVFPKRRPQSRARLHFLLREDLIKLNNISQEVRLLARHHIDTAEQLALYQKEQEVQITTLSAQRRALQKALRTKPVRDSPEQADAHRAQIKELSERLKALRREVHLCDDIAERSGVMAEKLKAVREDEKNQQKEEQQHEHIR